MLPAYKKTAIALATLASMGLAANVQANSQVRDNGFGYDYVDLGVTFEEWDPNFDINFLGGKISKSIDEHLFFLANLHYADGDYNIDGFRLGGGIGFHTPLQNRLDLVVSGVINYIDLSPGDNEIGYLVNGKVRHATTDQLELSGGLYLERYYDDNDIGLEGEVLFKANKDIGLGANVRLGGDIQGLGLFARVNF